MARTAITVQRLDTKGGELVTFVGADAVNGMQAQNDGTVTVLVRTGLNAAVTVKFPSVACQHGRLGDIQVSMTPVTSGQVQSFGPFVDFQNWGDGRGLLFMDFSGVSGQVDVAAVVPVST